MIMGEYEQDAARSPKFPRCAPVRSLVSLCTKQMDSTSFEWRYCGEEIDAEVHARDNHTNPAGLSDG